MEEGVLCLKWRDHRTTFTRTLTSLRSKGWYCDATLACEGRFYPVHRLVLGGCSEFFQRMFEVGEVTQQVVVVLADLCHQDLEALLDYMYVGEANILQGDLSRFMRAAEALKIRGLAEPAQSPEREVGEGKRPLSSQEDTREIKRRKDASSEKPKTRQNESDTSSKSSKGGRKELIGGKDQVGSSDESEIVSPAQLAAVELHTQPDSATTQPHTTPNTLTTTSQHGDNTHTQQSPIKFEDVQVKEEVEEWGGGEGGDGGADGEETNAYGTFSTPGLTYLTPQTSTQHPAPPHQPQTHQPHHTSVQPAVGWEGGAMSDQATQRAPFQRRMGRPTSEIWSHYSVVRSGMKTFVFCKYCSQRYSHPNATKMKIHVAKCERCPGDVRRQFSSGVKVEAENPEAAANKASETGWQGRSSELKVPQPVFSRVEPSTS